MVQQHQGSNGKKRRPNFFINDHEDIIVEILKHLEGSSLGVAACVCSLWRSIVRNDSLCQRRTHLCFRHVSPPPPSVRSVVVALGRGGYKRLYMACVRPVLSRLGRVTKASSWTRDEFQLSLSLFCIYCYERFGDVGGIINDEGKVVVESSSSSLMFLCNPSTFD
ncbi:SNEEZY, SLEEPY2 [Hibiscus trionum]|uniref:SNEEZY, SLEEPY2 n=1 Tax=Hibiscus trionum TaxID=183268 RepID=A0A9W7LTN5_HIBTR|nr:SNEEZY, SLEEPY2 [Hibiscus trionum]